MTKVVSLSARRSRCNDAKRCLKISIPEPVLAEIGIISAQFEHCDLKSDMSFIDWVNIFVIPLVLNNETILFIVVTFLLTS